VRITGYPAHGLFSYGKKKKMLNWNEKMENVIFSKFMGNKHTRFGKNMEPVSKKLYSDEYGVVINVGIICDSRRPWFGYSADGIAHENDEFVLLEVKCLSAGKKRVGDDFCRHCKCLQKVNNEFILRKTSMYYTQIQFGLGVTNMRKAKLLLYVHKSRSNIIVNVPRDDVYIETLFSKLTNIYFEHYLPFLSINKERLFLSTNKERLP
jgi:hypothetical protein